MTIVRICIVLAPSCTPYAYVMLRSQKYKTLICKANVFCSVCTTICIGLRHNHQSCSMCLVTGSHVYATSSSSSLYIYRKITLPSYNTIISSTARCSVGLYISQNLLFRVLTIFLIFQSLIVWVIMVWSVIFVFKMEESKNVEKAITCHHI
jgi:hypothetical protein